MIISTIWENGLCIYTSMTGAYGSRPRDFPMKEYYDAIKRRGYDGTVSFEICDRRYYCDPDKAIDDIVSWMKKNTHELGDVLEEI